ncbi:MAG TPA: hypothetical protein PLA94_22420 [Myxococcota bacterium]|nr:hypothetical protein [Myxococcota bacterium]
MTPATLRLSMDYNRYTGLLTCGDKRRELQLVGGLEERIEGDALDSCVLAVQGLSGLATLQFGKTYLCSGGSGLLRCEERGAGVLERVQQRQQARRTGDLRVSVKGVTEDDIGWVDCGGDREPEGGLGKGGTFFNIWADEDCSFSIDGVEGSAPVRGGFRYDCAVVAGSTRRLQCSKAGIFGSATGP